MDSAITHNHPQLKKNVPDLRAGDRVRVHQKIQEGGKSRIQVFEGLVIKTQHGNGINGTFTVRRISLGVGIEKNFPLHLPSIVKIEKVKSAKVRRAKLYYVRDLVGKKAQRLKHEKEEKGVWEDVIVAVDGRNVNLNDKDPEQEKIEREAEEAEKAEEAKIEGEEKSETEKKPAEQPKPEKEAESKEQKLANQPKQENPPKTDQPGAREKQESKN